MLKGNEILKIWTITWKNNIHEGNSDVLIFLLYSTQFEICFEKANQTLCAIPHILISSFSDRTIHDHKTYHVSYIPIIFLYTYKYVYNEMITIYIVKIIKLVIQIIMWSLNWYWIRTYQYKTSILKANIAMWIIDFLFKVRCNSIYISKYVRNKRERKFEKCTWNQFLYINVFLVYLTKLMRWKR